MPEILVTGGAGFIGHNLCMKMLAAGYKLVIVDNFNNFYNPLYKRENIEVLCKFNSELKAKSNFTVYEGDIRDEGFLDQVFGQHDISLIIHLAAYAGVRPSRAKPELYVDVNITGTIKLLEQARKRNLKKFIFASSSSVYGNNTKIPFTEEDCVDFPISIYAATKKAGELVCHTYHRLYDISMASLRFFTVYGRGQRPDLAIYKFTESIIKGKEIDFYGDGGTARDYTYVEDITEGIIGAVRWLSGRDQVFEIVNLGGTHCISLMEMLETLEDVLGKRAKKRLLPMQPGDVNRTCADISKAARLFGYCPKTDFRTGVEKFVAWFMKNRV